MLKPLKKTTYEDACRYGQELLDRLGEEEEFARIQERAASLNVEIMCSLRHTYAPDALNYVPSSDCTGPLPYGYAMELWFDLVGDGAVLCSQGEGQIQLSYAVTAIEQVNYLLFNRVHFFDYEDILSENPIFATLDDYLDRIEDAGCAPSPFIRDTLCQTEPRAERGLLRGRDAVGEGSYVELSSRPYNGTVGAADSLYFASDAFFPYRLFLLAATGDATLDMPRTLAGEKLQALVELLEDVPRAMHATHCFADLLSELGVSAYTPPPRAEMLLDSLTFLRKKGFLSDVAALAEFLNEQLCNGESVTFIP
jgi:hypothetical protein